MPRGGKREGAGRKRQDAAPSLAGGWYVYVLKEKEDNNYRKVGIASNPISRMSSHQVSNPRQLIFEKLWMLGGSDEYAAVEKAIHRAISPFHIRGEWFEVPLERIIQAMADTCESFRVQYQQAV